MRKPVLAALLATFAGPAMAADFAPAPFEPAPVVVAPVVPLYDWTGFSGGLQFGWASVDTNIDADGEHGTVGLRAYYDYDFGTFVLGGGVQYDFTDLELELEGSDAGIGTVDNVLRVGVRAGIDSNRNWYYLTGGYARVETDIDGIGDSDSDGYFVGAGYEVFLTQNITAGAEILYHEFDDFDDLPDLEADATTAALSLNFRF